MTAHKPKSVAEVVAYLRNTSLTTPAVAIVLGSGVNVLEDMDEQKSYSFQDVFGVSPSVVGHSGSITIGKSLPKLVKSSHRKTVNSVRCARASMRACLAPPMRQSLKLRCSAN